MGQDFQGINISPLQLKKTGKTKARILLVEDDVNLLEGVCKILELDGYEVLVAENGLDALAVLRKQRTPPDIIVSDIMMPHMDGIQLLEEVRSNRRWVSTPFIFLTARGEKVDVLRAKQLGVDDYVIKPYDPDDLLIAIQSKLDRYDGLKQHYKAAMDELKRNILTILNHEFRTPLTFVVAYADMLNMHIASKLSEQELDDFIRGVALGADRLRRLIENFILLVELETSDAQYTYEWRKAPIADLQSVFAAASNEVMQSEKGKHTFELHIPEDMPAFVADEQYLKRALVQLIDNAVKFDNERRHVVAGGRVDGEQVYLWVRDFGRGIPPEEREKILESFYQINRESNEDQGAGSGLTIVKGIVNLHSGKIDIVSKEGEGTTFTIILPLRFAHQIESAP